MPSRKKAPERDVKATLAKSLREYGANPTQSGPHANFYRKVSTQAVSQSLVKRGPVKVELRKEKIPKERDDAIEVVCVSDLEEYLIKDIFDMKSKFVYDNLEPRLTRRDDPVRLLHWPPYYFRKDNAERLTKPDFQYFDPATLDPFQRFSLRSEKILPAQLAFNDCFDNDDNWLNGYAFEAMVASHAVHNESCRRCFSSNSLHWCGGSDTSWRDLYCDVCQSCFEIKSKADKAAIDKIFKFDAFTAGSYRKWCEEDFPDRVKGSDYIVFVSRKPTEGKGWAVEIAEIGTALPVVFDWSFAEANAKTVSLRTCLTLRNRQPWFHVPGGDPPDLKRIFRRAFEKVFPDQWVEVGGGGEIPVSREESDQRDRPSSVEDIIAGLEGFSVAIWDDY